MRRAQHVGPATLAIGAALSASLACPASARAQTAAACEASFEKGQEVALGAKLLDAREAFLACVHDDCPSLLRSACGKKLDELAPRIPSVVASAQTSLGRDLTDVEVSIDGSVRLRKLDGTAFDLDPGPHHVRMRWRTAVVEQDVVIREGDKLRALSTVFPETATPAAPASEGSHLPASVYALGGVSLAGFVTGGYFGIRALVDNGDLHAQCAPQCSQSAENGVRDRFIVADIALGVGIVTAAVAVYLALTSR